MAGIYKNEQYYNGAAIADLATTNVPNIVVVPTVIGATADRVETQAVLAALEADLVVVATKLNFALAALKDAGIIAP